MSLATNGSASARRRRGALLLAAGLGLGAGAADFEVATGYLSTNAQALATSYGWSLVWEAGEDRLIEHAFPIGNDSLQGALEGLLGAYQGQFVADLYRSNRVVVVSIPLPQLEVVLPGAEPVAAGPALDDFSERDAPASGVGAEGAGAVAAASLGEEPLPPAVADNAAASPPLYEAAASGQEVAAASVAQ